MARLVLTIRNNGGELDLLAGRYRFERRHVKLVSEGLGDRALFYGAERGAYFAMARITSIEAEARDPKLLVARLADIQFFERPVPLSPAVEPAKPRSSSAPQVRLMAETEFDAISNAGYARGLHEETEPFIPGFAEAPQGAFSLERFDSQSPEFARQVIEAYGGRCAFTGASQAYEAEDIDIVPIIPVELGGPEILSNFIPAARIPATAFAAGHLTIGQRTEFITALDRVDPEFLETFNPSGKLTLPQDPAARPDPEALDFHRRTLFNR